MANQNASVTTTAVFLSVGDVPAMTVRNLGPNAIYYSNVPTVTSSVYTGTIAANSTATVGAGQYFVTASGTSPVIFSPGATSYGGATLEELVAVVPLIASISANVTIPLWYAPFPVRIAQFAFIPYGGTLAASDTDYWTATLTKRQAPAGSSTVAIAAKTTQTNASGGEAVSFHVPWTFDAAVFDLTNQIMDVRDTLEVVYAKTLGAPASIAAPGLHIFRYEPI